VQIGIEITVRSDAVLGTTAMPSTTFSNLMIVPV